MELGRLQKKPLENPNAGINFNKANKKYYARIYKEGKEYYVGTFARIEDAREARRKALLKVDETGFTRGYTRSRSKKDGTGESDDWKTLREPDQTSFGNPEHVLRYRVLMGAIDDLKEPESDSVLRGAIDWFNGRDVYPKGYSFDEICGIFRLDPDAVRDSLRVKFNRKELR